MKTKRIKIIPAIDLIGGRCVRLSQGDYDRCSVYGDDPVDVAKSFEDCGIEMLHLVDLEGAKAQKPANLNVLERIASATSLSIEFGGGIKSDASIVSAFDAGASRVICGSVACSMPDLFVSWLHAYGGERIVLGADVRDGMVAVNGWKDRTDIGLDELISAFLPEGLETAIVTDISRDGMLSGAAVELYEGLMSRFPSLGVVASGGVGSFADVEALGEAGVGAVIVGKAIYEGRITLSQLKSLNGN